MRKNIIFLLILFTQKNLKNPKVYYELLINTGFEYLSIIEIIERDWPSEIEDVKR